MPVNLNCSTTVTSPSVTPPGGTGVCYDLVTSSPAGSDRAWSTVTGAVTPPSDTTRATASAGGNMMTFISQWLSANFTISVAPYPSFYGRESNAKANVVPYARVGYLRSSTYTWMGSFTSGSELGTSNATRAGSITGFSSTNLLTDDRIVLEFHYDDAPSVTMASGYTVYMNQGYVQFNEALTFYGGPGSSTGVPNSLMLLGCGI